MYAGVLNYETVYYMSSLFGIKQVHGCAGLSDDDWSILIFVGVWQMKVWQGYFS